MTLAFAAACTLAAPALAAEPVCPSGGSPGTITITEKLLDPQLALQSAVVKAAQRCVLTKAAEDDGWKVNLVAHLSRKADTAEVNIVFYDPAAAAKPGEPRRPVQAYPTTTKKGATIMLASVEIKPEDGFKAGVKYNVLITRLVNGREDVYAKTTLELK